MYFKISPDFHLKNTIKDVMYKKHKLTLNMHVIIIIIVVIGFNPTNYTVKESDGMLLVTVMVLEGYIPDGENVTVAVSTRAGTATGTCIHVHVCTVYTCQCLSKVGLGQFLSRNCTYTWITLR